MIEIFLVVTPGVIVTDKCYLFEPLNISVPKSRLDTALELGLISERLAARNDMLSLGLSWPFCKRSRPLPDSKLAAVYASLIHNAQSMLLSIIVAIASTVFGLVFSSLIATIIGIAYMQVLASILVHEAAHALTYRFCSLPGDPAILVADGFRCHIVRLPLRRWRECAVVVSGPLSPLVLLVVFIPFAEVAPLACLGWLCTSVGHAVSLLVPVGDGRNLYQVIRSWRKAANSG